MARTRVSIVHPSGRVAEGFIRGESVVEHGGAGPGRDMARSIHSKSVEIRYDGGKSARSGRQGAGASGASGDGGRK